MFDATKLPAVLAQQAAAAKSSSRAATDDASADSLSHDPADGNSPVLAYPARALVLSAGRYHVADNSK